MTIHSSHQTPARVAGVRRACRALAAAASLLAAGGAAAQTYQVNTEPATAFDTVTTDVVWELVDTDYPVDDDKELVNIGFTFDFGGVSYTQVRVLANGALHFGANQGFHKDYTNEAMPITNALAGPGFEEPADRVIAPYWDDLEPSRGGTVRYGTLGSAPNRRFVASWENVPHYNLAGTYTFQVVLYETGEIRFRYGASSATGASATIGVEVDDSDYTQHSYNTNGAVGAANDLVFRLRHYFGIAHGGSGNTCAVTAVTFTRYDHTGAVDTGYTGTMSLSTSTGNGTWSVVSAGGTLVDGGGGNATYTFAPGDAGVAVLGLADPVTETVNIDAVDGYYRELGSLDPNLTFSAGGPTDTYRDDFTAVSFANQDGTVAWATDWIEVDGDGAGPGAGNVLVSGGALRLDDRPNTGGTPGVQREADLSSYAGATFSFSFQTTSGVDTSDAVTIDVSANGGGAWTTLETINGISGTSSGSRSYDISAYMSSNTRVRMRVTNLYGGGSETFVVDYAEIAAAGGCGGANHFAITHSGNGINCQAEPVTITAHQADHSTATSYTGTVTLSTDTGNGDWAVVTGAGALVNAGGGSATYAFDAADSGVAVLALRDTFVETVDIDVTDGTAAEAPGEDPSLAFARSGFNFLAGGVADAIGTQIAGKASNTAPGVQTIELQAIDTNTATGACEAALVGAVDVEMAFECRNPGTCGASQVRVNGSPVAGNGSGAVSSYTSMSLDFGSDTDATATLVLDYADAGAVRLHARHELDLASGTGSGNFMLGTSNEFVVRPFGFELDFSGDRAANGTAGASYAADASGSIFVKAGESFDATVRAVVWQAGDDADADGAPDAGADLSDNAATVRFGAETPAAAVDVTHALFAPAGGAVGTLTGGAGIGGFTAGAVTAPLAIGEVGIFDLAVAETSYLGSGQDVLGAAARVGRFIPARLSVGDSSPAFRNGPDIAWTCGFTYMEQPFTFTADPAFTVTAQNLAGATTSNYGAAFWKLGPAPYLGARSYTDTSGGGATLDAPAIGTVALTGDTDFDGQGTLTLSNEVFAYTRPVSPVAPFAAEVDMVLAGADLTDADGVCYHPSDVSCRVGDATMSTPQSYTVNAIAGAALRFGRLRLINAGGSELLPVTVPLAAQYHDGSGFVSNVDDLCTSLGTAAMDLANDAADPPLGTATIAVSGGTTTGTVANQPLAAGEAGLGFSAPLADNTGHADIRFDLSTATGAALEWLRYDWDGDGSHDDDPTGRATFGIFEGSRNLIYMREPW